LKSRLRHNVAAKALLGSSVALWVLVGGVAAAAPKPDWVTPQNQGQSQAPRLTTVPRPTPTWQVAQAAPAPAPSRPARRAVTLTLPLKDGQIYLGDVVATIAPNGDVSISAARVYDLLARILDARALERFKTATSGKEVLTTADMTEAGIPASYDAQALEIVMTPPASVRASRSLQVASLDRAKLGTFNPPARHSGYVNLRSSVDYVHEGFDTGWATPSIQMDGAVRLGDLVLESEGVLRPGRDGNDFQRFGTRWLWDDLNNLARLTGGDLRTTSRGFQSAPSMGGVSWVRSYSTLDPQLNVRPRGSQSFTLNEASSVDVQINGQSVRRLRLQPGVYDLRDFPFAQGANDVRLTIENSAGQRENIRFNIFLDRAQLGIGLTEFGVYLGVESRLGEKRPIYDGPGALSAYVRRGFTENLTLGGNLQVDEKGWMTGVESVMATSFANLSLDLSASEHNNVGSGTAMLFTAQRLFQSTGSGSAVNFSFETRSRRFAPIASGTPDNPYAWETSFGYSQGLGPNSSIAIDARHSEGRGLNGDSTSVRVSSGWRISSRASFTTDATWEDSARGDDFSIRAAFIYRLGEADSLRGEYDTRDDRARIALQGFRGAGVGAWNYDASLDRTPDTSGFTGSVAYIANRAELGAAHSTVFDGDFSGVTDQRTSLRLGTALAWADGAFTIGRPIYDAFAIVRPHSTLGDASVVLNPQQDFQSGRSGALGSVLASDLGAYAERSLSIAVDGAPAGYDLGSGSFRVFPGYRQGYNLTVGSDYSATVAGKLFDADGKPIALLAGTATEQGNGGKTVTVFTNRDGRFLIGGLRPGNWLIEMPTSPVSRFSITIPETRDGVARLGDLRASTQ
jgi:outer membrane usher protein